MTGCSSTLFYTGTRGSFSDKVTLEQRTYGSKGAIQTDKNKFKGPEEGVSLTSLRDGVTPR